jgi:hypothetical protein
MRKKINFILVILISFCSFSFSSEIQRVTYASWNKPDVELLYLLPKTLDKDTTILFIIHGGSRGAERYLKYWIADSRDKNVILVAPHFTKDNYPYYSTLGMATHSGKLINDRTNWLRNSISSFHTFFRSRYNLNANKYRMFGFSGGSQFVHRYLMYGVDSNIEKAAIGSAGWYTFLDYNPFPYGIKNMPLEPGRVEWLMSKEVLFLLGDQDNDPKHSSLNKSKGALKQGAHRYERGYNYFRGLTNLGNHFQIPFRWRYKVINGVDHDTKEMSKAASSFLLEDLDYKN